MLSLPYIGPRSPLLTALGNSQSVWGISPFSREAPPFMTRYLQIPAPIEPLGRLNLGLRRRGAYFLDLSPRPSSELCSLEMHLPKAIG